MSPRRYVGPSIYHILLEGNRAAWETVASLAKVPASRWMSVALMATTTNSLRSPGPGRIAHGPMSMRFVEQPSHVNWARYLTTYSTPTAQSYTEATRRLDDPKLSNETTFNAASGTDLSFLSSCDTSEGLALKYTLEGFELDKLGRANMVDVSSSYDMTVSCAGPDQPVRLYSPIGSRAKCS